MHSHVALRTLWSAIRRSLRSDSYSSLESSKLPKKKIVLFTCSYFHQHFFVEIERSFGPSLFRTNGNHQRQSNLLNFVEKKQWFKKTDLKQYKRAIKNESSLTQFFSKKKTYTLLHLVHRYISLNDYKHSKPTKLHSNANNCE